MIKRTLKFTLCVGLLAAGVLAYAEGPVTLTDGNTVTWADFAKVINTGKLPVDVEVKVDSTAAVKGAWNVYVQAGQDLIDANNAVTLANNAVTLANGEVETAQTAVDNAQKAVDDQQAKIDAINNDVDGTLTLANKELTRLTSLMNRVEPKTDTKTTNVKYSDTEWFKIQRSAFDTFREEYNAEHVDKAYVWYYVPTSGRSRTLYLSFTDPGSAIPTTGQVYTKISEDNFYNKVIAASDITFSSVRVFLGFKKDSTTEYNYTGGANGQYPVATYNSGSYKDDLINIVYNAFENLGDQIYETKTETVQTQAYQDALKKVEDQEAVVEGLENDLADEKRALTPLNTTLSTAKQTLANKQAAATTAEGKLATAQSNQTTARTNFNEKKAAWETAEETFNQYVANAQATANANEIANNYQIVTLNSDITISTPITKSNYDGTINGNGNIITLDGISAVCANRFSGHLYNAAINGTAFATSTNGAEFDNVAVNAGTQFRFYGENGELVAPATGEGAIKSLGELGFKARAVFGADINGTALTKLTDDTRVFEVKAYNTPGITPEDWSYSNLQDGVFVNIPAVAKNTFIESSTADYYDGVANVFSGSKSKLVEIEDGKDLTFYCPKNINAERLTYSREFNGLSAVCLPFPVKKGDNISTVLSYDNEATDHTFVFTYEESTVEANTPLLIVASGKLPEMTNVDLLATPASQIKDGGIPEHGTSKSCGNFKPANTEGFLGGTESYRIFGLNKNKKFQRASTDATFNAFRMVIASNYGEETAPNEIRGIRVMNKMGIDITGEVLGQASGVEDINAASSLSIVGGQGAIEFNSDADYGKVEIYNVNGGLVTVANVMTGTTSVNVEKGIYIVMGKKVMVK